MAETLFVAARGLMAAGRYAEACAKLAESQRLDPASGTLLNLAVCHEHEGKLTSAWGEFRQAQHEAHRAGRADREALARTHAAALEPELPFLAFDVREAASVPGLTVVRNGVAVSAAAGSTELPVDPGRVSIVASAPGYQPQSKEVVIAPRQHLTITLGPLVRVAAATALATPGLHAQAAPAAPSGSRAEAPPASPSGSRAEAPPASTAGSTSWTRRRSAGFGLLVGGVLTAGAGAVAGTLALHQRGESDDACPQLDAERRCTSAGVSAMEAAQRWALASDVLIGLGALAAGVGTFLLVTGNQHADASRVAQRDAAGARAATWSWRLAASPHGARGSLARSF